MKRAAARLLSARITRATLGLAIGIVCLYLALRGVDWSEVQKIFWQTDLIYLALALVVVLANVALKILRWQTQLIPAGQDISLAVISASFLSAQMLNYAAPVRVGEIQRIYIIGGYGPRHGYVIGAIVAEKFLDMLAYAVLIGMLLIWIPLPNWIGGSVSALMSMMVIQSILMFLLVFKRKYFIGLIEKLSQRASERTRDFVLKNTRSGFASLDIFQKPSEALKLSLITSMIWSTALLTNYLVLFALDIQAPLVASLLVAIAVQAGLSLPALPGKIGVFEFACILALEYYGVGRASALSYGILLHVVVMTPVLVSGLISFFYLQIRSGRSVSR